MATKLFEKLDWTITDLNGSPFIGADNAYSSTPGGLKLFDLRPYRAVYCYLSILTLTGGTTPQVYFRACAFDSPGPLASNAAQIGNSTSQGLPISTILGGQIILGEGGGTPVSSASTAYVNAFPVTYGYKQLFSLFQLDVTGSPTGLTGLRTAVWGIV